MHNVPQVGSALTIAPICTWHNRATTQWPNCMISCCGVLVYKTKLSKIQPSNGFSSEPDEVGQKSLKTQASSNNLQGVVDCRVSEAVMSTMAPDRSAELYCWMEQGQGGYLQCCCSSTQPDPANHLMSVTLMHHVSFLRSDSRCQRYVSNLSDVTSRYLGLEQKDRVLLLWLTFSSGFAFLVVEVEDCQHHFCSAEP